MSLKKFNLTMLFTLVVISAGLLLTACGASDSYMDVGEQAMEYYAADQEESMRESAPAADYDTLVKSEVVSESKLRHVIRNGSIELTVTDTRETISAVRTIVEAANGMISNSNVYEMREGQFGAHLTIRVPNNNFDSIMEQLQELGKARNVQTGSEDVTMQYIDLESRLKNQVAQEERLVEILEMADTVEDVLEVERELYRVRGEIETMTAQFNYLKDQVSFSTISLNLREEAISTEGISPGAFDNLGDRIEQAFIGSINFILNAASIMIIAFSALLPVLVIFGIMTVFIVLMVRRAKKRKKKTVVEAETEQKQ